MKTIATADKNISWEDAKVIRIERALLRRLHRESNVKKKVLIWKQIDERLRQHHT